MNLLVRVEVQDSRASVGGGAAQGGRQVQQSVLGNAVDSRGNGRRGRKRVGVSEWGRAV